MNTLFKILTFFRIVDANDQLLSITSIAMFVSLYRLTTTHDASFTDIGALIATLSAYSIKKVINNNAQKGTNETNS